MTEVHDHYKNARNIAVDILRREKYCTPELIQDVTAKAVRAIAVFAPDALIDTDGLVSELRHLFSIEVEGATVLDDNDPTAHEAWLPESRGNIQWRFWNRYVTYLERDFGMAPTEVNNLHELTDMVLGRLEKPSREGKWDRRGMVVGSVQSGKTANYVGLINKAIDAGYKLVIVLAGVHNNLRAQTQLRVDEGVLGFDTQKSRKLNNESQWVGVGKLPGEPLVIHSLTSSHEKGDFSKTIAEKIGVMLGSDPVVLVMKKQVSLLGNLINWVLHVTKTDVRNAGRKLICNVPILLIDDEADNASINTKDKKKQAVLGKPSAVTAINGKIRLLLDAFEKSAYVGYTATPFANIFINPDAETPEHGEDIFPRSFIVNVKPSSHYVGPQLVFGLDGDVDAGIEPSAQLPIVKKIDDYDTETRFPPKHRIEHIPLELPPSLKRAIRCFILVCAARRARGQEKKHNSMLVHVTRYVSVQEHVVRLIRDEVNGIQRRIEFGDGSRLPTIRDELFQLWMTEFVPVTEQMSDRAGPPVSWPQIDQELHKAVSKIAILAINGTAKDVLDYKEHEANGRSVVAVGGDKLSRGLTLEGLSVSYYLRTAAMYDTLMQMGRWFGYRPGYLDLCRLFTTGQLVEWYRHIALVDAELRREFDYMVAANLKPADYGLRVRTHPGGMTITALNKMCHSSSRTLSWTGVLAQTSHLPTDRSRIERNFIATKGFVTALGAPTRGSGRGTRVWAGCQGKQVIMLAEFLENLKFPLESARASGSQLADFIRKQSRRMHPELTSWTVALISVLDEPVNPDWPIANFDIGWVIRTPEAASSGGYTLKKSNILNPKDEAIDFVGAKFDKGWFSAIAGKKELKDDLEWLEQQISEPADGVAISLTARWQRTDPPKIKAIATGQSKMANGRVLRVLRRSTDGLLLIYPLKPLAEAGVDPTGPAVIGVALSFPVSQTVAGVNYRVNRVWSDEILEDASYDD